MKSKQEWLEVIEELTQWLDEMPGDDLVELLDFEPSMEGAAAFERTYDRLRTIVKNMEAKVKSDLTSPYEVEIGEWEWDELHFFWRCRVVDLDAPNTEPDWFIYAIPDRDGRWHPAWEHADFGVDDPKLSYTNPLLAQAAAHAALLHTMGKCYREDDMAQLSSEWSSAVYNHHHNLYGATK